MDTDKPRAAEPQPIRIELTTDGHGWARMGRRMSIPDLLTWKRAVTGRPRMVRPRASRLGRANKGRVDRLRVDRVFPFPSVLIRAHPWSILCLLVFEWVLKFLSACEQIAL